MASVFVWVIKPNFLLVHKITPGRDSQIHHMTVLSASNKQSPHDWQRGSSTLGKDHCVLAMYSWL